MDDRRPPDPDFRDEPVDRDRDTTPQHRRPGTTPDARPTQPIAVPPGAGAADPGDEGERLALLQRLTPTELAILRHRCSGATTSQIATHLGITPADARLHLSHLLDKLGITYGRDGTSFSRLSAFCPLVSQLGPSAGTGGMPVEPPAGMPSQRAVELTDADDMALAFQHGGPPPSSGGDGRQRWILGGVLAFVLVAALVALLLFMDDDDNGDDTTGDAQATEEVATETAGAILDPTATATVEEPSPTMEPTETEVPATETPEPDDEATEEVATATTEAEPTATEPEPTDTPDETDPTATATPVDADPTPTEAAPDPTPITGELAYEADWSSSDDNWDLTDGWAVEDGELVTTGAGAAPLIRSRRYR